MESRARIKVEEGHTALSYNPRVQTLNLVRAAYGEFFILAWRRLLKDEILMLILFNVVSIVRCPFPRVGRPRLFRQIRTKSAPKRKHHISFTKIRWLMRFGKMVDVYSEIVSTLCR
jgi:hypothetical protein